MLRKVSELVARYKLEPSLRDVFVEGRVDAQFVGRILRNLGLRNVIPYEVKTVEVPPGEVISRGYEDGKRGRVLYLASEFEQTLAPESAAVTCVADRDYDYLLGRTHTSPFLLLVDYSCSEMYAFDEATIEEVIKAAQPGLQKPAKTVMAALSSVLETLFVLRTTNIKLGLGLAWLESFTDDCTITGDAVELELESFLTRYLNTKGMLARRQQFRAAYDLLRAGLQRDPRLSINGHDFVTLLAWYLRKHCKKANPLIDPKVLQQLLFAYVDPIRVSGEPFFRALVLRVTRP